MLLALNTGMRIIKSMLVKMHRGKIMVHTLCRVEILHLKFPERRDFQDSLLQLFPAATFPEMP